MDTGGTQMSKKAYPLYPNLALCVCFTDEIRHAGALAVRGQQELLEGRVAKAVRERAGERRPISSPAGA